MNLKKSIIKMLTIGMLALTLVFTVENVISIGHAATIMDNDNSDGSGNTANETLEGIEGSAKTAISGVQRTIVSIAGAVGPLAIIICLVLMLFTHDERKIAALSKTAITILVVLVLILFINGNEVVNLIKDLMGTLVGVQK